MEYLPTLPSTMAMAWMLIDIPKEHIGSYIYIYCMYYIGMLVDWRVLMPFFGSVCCIGIFSKHGGSPPRPINWAPSGPQRASSVWRPPALHRRNGMGKSAGKSWMCSVVFFWGRGCHHELIWNNYRCIHLYLFVVFLVYTYVLIIDHEFPDCFKRCY